MSAVPQVERLDRRQQPPGYTVRGRFWSPGREDDVRVVPKIGHLSAKERVSAAMERAWEHYEQEHSPPGLVVQFFRNRSRPGGRWTVSTSTHIEWMMEVEDREHGKAAARRAAWAWYWRRVAVAGALTEHLDVVASTLPDPARAAVWPWPAALAWPDEKVAAVERWLAEGGELPEVLRG